MDLDPARAPAIKESYMKAVWALAAAMTKSGHSSETF
jgi:hypothetical protein